MVGCANTALRACQAAVTPEQGGLMVIEGNGVFEPNLTATLSLASLLKLGKSIIKIPGTASLSLW